MGHHGSRGRAAAPLAGAEVMVEMEAGGGRVTKRAVGNRFHPRLRHLPPTELLDPSMGGGG